MNDPGGTRWPRLFDRTVDMFLANVGTGRAPRRQEREAMIETTTDEIAENVFRLST